MSKIELNDKTQAKSMAWEKKLSDLFNQSKALENRVSNAAQEVEQLTNKLRSMDKEYIGDFDEKQANAINKERRAIQEKIEDLELLKLLNVKATIKDKVMNDSEMETIRTASYQEYAQFTKEVDSTVKELKAEIERLENAKRSHMHNMAELVIKLSYIGVEYLRLV